MKRAVVISFNWRTGEKLHEAFEGPGAADRAAGWAHKSSFLWRDFPASKGWEHWAHWNREAGLERGSRILHEMLGDGKVTDNVPK